MARLFLLVAILAHLALTAQAFYLPGELSSCRTRRVFGFNVFN